MERIFARIPALRSLGWRNYRLYFFCQGLSHIGTWIQTIATGWLIYRLTDSSWFLGLSQFATYLPVFLFAAFAGVLLDRWPRRRVLVVTQSAMMLISLILSLLTFSGLIRPLHIVLCNFSLGVVMAFDNPARQSFLHEIIGSRDNIGNAIALNSFLFNGARMIGPAIAGILVARVGEAWCFAINSFSFTVIIWGLLAMRIPRKKALPSLGLKGLALKFREGLSYASHTPSIRIMLLFLFGASITATPASVLMPVFARDVLGGGSHTLGYLMSGIGIGALAGALFMASRKSLRGIERIAPAAAVLYGGGIFCMALSRSVYLSIFIALFIGMGMMAMFATSNTIIQSTAEEDKIGRVMSLYTMAFSGAMPFGALVSGYLGNLLGAPPAAMIGGSLCVLCGIVLSRNLKPVARAVNALCGRSENGGCEEPAA